MTIYVGILISFVVGALVYIISDIGFAVLFSVILFLLNLLGVLLFKFKRKCVVYSAFFVLGAVLFANASEPTASVFDNYVMKYVEIEGIVSEVPNEHTDYFSYVITAKKLNYLDESKNISESLKVNSEYKLRVGNNVRLRGFISEIMPPDNSTEFDYKRYYKSKGIYYTQYAEEVELLNERSFLFSPKYFSEYVKGNISLVIDKHFKDDDAGILKAVLLGIRSDFSDEFRETLVKTSAIRFLYPSFLHMFLLMSFVAVISRKFRNKTKIRMTVIALVAFCLLNGSLITFVRAGVLALITLIYKKVRGFSSYPDTISLTIVACLIANPLLIYNSGFVMSVAIGILLHNFYRPLSEKLKFIRNKKLKSYVAMSLIATIGIIPLGAYFFGGIPLYSIIFTILYTPLTLITFFLTPFMLLIYTIFGLDLSVGIILNGVLTLMKNIPQMVSYLPWHHIVIPKTNLFGFTAFFFLVCLIRELIQEEFDKRKINLSLIPLTILLLISVVFNITEIGKMYVTFINVGQGDAALIKIKGKDTVLIDGGGSIDEERYSIGKEVYIPYLNANGIDKVDLAIVSHFHPDHMSGIKEAIKSLRVHTVMMPYTSEYIKERDELIAIAESFGTEIIEASKGDKIEFDSGLMIEVLSPSRNSEYKDNDLSLVLKVSYGEVDMLFTGDITEEVEKELKGTIGNVDIVKVPHHGSKYSSNPDFVKELSPKFAIVSAGRNNMYGHPSERVIEEYTNNDARFLRTDYMCDITLKCYKDGRIGAGWFGEVLKWQ